MMSSPGEGLKWVFQADVSDLTSGLKAAAQEFERTGKAAKDASNEMANSAKGMSTATSNLGRMGKAVLAFVGAKKLAEFSAEASRTSAHLERLRLTSDRVFGTMSSDVQKWSDHMAGAYNLTKTEAMGFTSQMGVMLNSLGFTSQQSAAASVNLSKMAGEIAYMHGLEPESAFKALQAGIAGNNQPLRRLGYNLSVANLELFMMQNGINHAYKDLSSYSQALVRHNYLMQVTSQTNGITAAMIDTVSGQVQFLRVQWQSFTAAVGDVINIALLPLLKMLNTVVGVLVRAAQAAAIFFQTLFGVAPKVSKASDQMGGLGTGIADSFDKGTKASKKMYKEISKLLGIDELNIIPDDPEPSAGGGGGAPKVPAGGFDIDMPIDSTEIEKASKITDGFRKKWEDVANSVKKYATPIKVAIAAIVGAFAGWLVFSHWATVGPILMTIGKAAFSLLNPMTAVKLMSSALGGTFQLAGTAGTFLWNSLTGLISGTIGAVSSFAALVSEVGFMNAVTATGTTVMEALAAAFSVPAVAAAALIAVFAAIAAAITQLWLTNEEFRATLTEAWYSIGEVLQSIWDSVVAPVLEGFKIGLLLVWTHGIQPLWDAWVNFVDVIVSGIAELWLEVQPLFVWLVETFGPIISAVINALVITFSVVFAAIGQVLAGFLNIASGIIDLVIDVFRGIVRFLVGVFTGDWDRAWSGIAFIFESVGRTLKNIWQGVWDFIVGLFQGGGRIFDGITEGIVNTFKFIVNGLIRGINKIIAIPFNSLKSLLNSIGRISVMGLRPFSAIHGGWISVPQIPQFADGGIAFGETLGVFAEYSNARTNPEVIAPLDRLQAMLNTGDTTDPAVYREIIRLLTILVDKDPTIDIDGKRVDKVLGDIKAKRQRQYGYR